MAAHTVGTHTVRNAPLKLMKNVVNLIMNLGAAVPHRREFVAEVFKNKSDTCVAVRAVEVRGTASKLASNLLALLGTSACREIPSQLPTRHAFVASASARRR